MLSRHLHHTAGLYHFLRQLYRAAVAHEQHRVLWFESGRHSERSYRRHGLWHNFRPDAAFAYQAGEQRLVAWLEWDEGSMSLRHLAAKVHEYQRVVRGREWVRYDTPTVPLLLFVVPDSGQERRVVQIARRILANMGITVRSTTANRLATCGPLAPKPSRIYSAPRSDVCRARFSLGAVTSRCPRRNQGADLSLERGPHSDLRR